MTVFQFSNYKVFLKEIIKLKPQKGRGQLENLATHLNVHQSFISHVLSGPKNFSEEQSCHVAQYFGLMELESEYFVALVQHERASGSALKAIIQKNLKRIKAAAATTDDPLVAQGPLSENERSVFYSSWMYSAVRLLTSIPQFSNSGIIAEHLRLPVEDVERVLEFLLQTGLCVKKDGKIRMGVGKTRVTNQSPMLIRHHLNWRFKGIERMQQNIEKGFFIRLPCRLRSPTAKK